MLPVFVAAGTMMLAGAAAGYVGGNTENLRTDLNSD